MNLVINLLIKFLPSIIVKVYDDLLKQKLSEWAASTENDIDDALLEAIESFIDGLR